MHYCVGDIHGYFDEFMTLIGKIENKDPEARFILTGDLIDRGPQVMETVRWAMENITKDGKYQSVMGNHEDMVLNWFRKDYSLWERFKASKRLFPQSRYDFSDRLAENNLYERDQVQPIMAFFQSLPLYIKTTVTTAAGNRQEYVIAHGWYSKDYFAPDINPNDTHHTIIWERESIGYGNPSDEFIVVHGHTPTVERACEEKYYLSVDPEPINAGLIAYRKNAINLDGGRPYRDYEKRFCTISAICLETMEEFFAEEPPADYKYYENKYQVDLKKRIRGTVQ